MNSCRRVAGVVLATALLAATGSGVQPGKAGKPDLIVSDVFLEGDNIVVEVQNQGPGEARKGATVEAIVSGRVTEKVKDATGKERLQQRPVSVTVKVPVPGVMKTDRVSVPADKVGGADEAKRGGMISVVLDPKNTLAEEREKNNDYHKQLPSPGQVVKPRADYKDGTELPDLVITDITADATYLYAHYKNAGKGVTGADFLIRFRCGKAAFNGNSYYRFPVPAAGEEVKTGGLSPALIGVKPGDEVEVEVTIDHEDRVRETDKKNNTFKKKVKVEKK